MSATKTHTLGGAVLQALGIDPTGVVSFRIYCGGHNQAPRVMLRKILIVDKKPTFTFETREIVSATQRAAAETVMEGGAAWA